jgi:hypothetical protein
VTLAAQSNLQYAFSSWTPGGALLLVVIVFVIAVIAHKMSR